MAALLYTGGAAAHLARVAFGFPTEAMPYEVDWVVSGAALYSGAGLVRFAWDVDWRGRWEKALHAIIAVHLLVSATVHAWILATESHEVLSIFGRAYSGVAVVYFGVFAWRSWTMRAAPCAVSNRTRVS